MSKRRAERQLTSDDDPEALVSDNGTGTWSKAPEAVLKKRKIIKATRRGVQAATPAPAATPAATPAAPAAETPAAKTEGEAAPAAKATEPAKEEPKPFSFAPFGTGSTTPFSFAPLKPADGKEGSTTLNFWGSASSGTTGNPFGGSATPGDAPKGFNFSASASSVAEWAPAPKKKVPTIEKPKEPLKSGEEDDTNHHETRAKLYQLSEKEGQMTWAERGKGQLLINQNNKTKKYRLILRTDKVNRVILNAALYKSLTITTASEKLLNLGLINIAAPVKKDDAAATETKEEAKDDTKKEETKDEAKTDEAKDDTKKEEPTAKVELYALRFASKENADGFKAKVESIVKTLED